MTKRIIILFIVCMLGLYGCKADPVIQTGLLGELIDTENGVAISPFDEYVFLDYFAFENGVAVLPEVFNDEYTIDSVGEGTFGGNKDLSSVVIPDSYKYLCMFSFSNCPSLKTIEIGKGLKSVEVLAFAESNAVESVTISEENPYLYAEGLCIIERESEKVICGFAKSVIPDGVKVIGTNAFAYATGAEEYILPQTVVKIEGAAFANCSIKTTDLPESVETIEKYAFSGCTALERMYIPQSVTLVEECILDDCKNVTVYCEAESKPEGWSDDWLAGSENVTVVWGYTPEE